MYVVVVMWEANKDMGRGEPDGENEAHARYGRRLGRDI
jgi:hypothetical protein